MSLYRNFNALIAFMAIWFVFTVVTVVSYNAFADSHGWKLIELMSLIAFMFGCAGAIMLFIYLPLIHKDLSHAHALQSAVIGMLNALDNQNNRSHEQFVFALVVEKMLPVSSFCKGTFTKISADARTRLATYVNTLLLKEEHEYGILIKDYSRHPVLIERIAQLKQLALALKDPPELVESDWQQHISEIR